MKNPNIEVVENSNEQRTLITPTGDLVVESSPHIVYRISQKKTERSMWYDLDAKFDPLEEVFAEIPMPEDGRKFLKELGRGELWVSSVDEPGLLKLWFPNMHEIFEKLNFVAHSYAVKEWIQLPNEVVFNRGTARQLDDSFSLEKLLKN